MSKVDEKRVRVNSYEQIYTFFDALEEFPDYYKEDSFRGKVTKGREVFLNHSECFYVDFFYVDFFYVDFQSDHNGGMKVELKKEENSGWIDVLGIILVKPDFLISTLPNGELKRRLFIEFFGEIA